MKTVGNKREGFPPSLHQVDDEIIERFTQELLKEHPWLSEEEARGFIFFLKKQIEFLI